MGNFNQQPMNTETKASDDRRAHQESRMAHCRLAHYPDIQAEAIANHYTSVAMEALQLKKMVEMAREYGDHDGKLQDGIDYKANLIKKAHMAAFGIELEWNAQTMSQ